MSHRIKYDKNTHIYTQMPTRKFTSRCTNTDSFIVKLEPHSVLQRETKKNIIFYCVFLACTSQKSLLFVFRQAHTNCILYTQNIVCQNTSRTISISHNNKNERQTEVISVVESICLCMCVCFNMYVCENFFKLFSFEK